MKKTILIITCVLVLVLFAACGSNAAEPQTSIAATQEVMEPSSTPEPTPAVSGISSVIGNYWLSYCVDGEGNIVLNNETFTANYDIQLEDNFSLQDNMRVYREEGVYPYYYAGWRLEGDVVTIFNEDEERTFVVYESGLKSTVPFSLMDEHLLSGSVDLIENPEDTYLVYEKKPNGEFPYDYTETDYIDLDGSWGYVSASSILDYSVAYETLNMFDNNLSTAWVEGIEGNGEGERIFISVLEPDYSVSGISLINGYTKSETLYYQNARLKSATVTITTDSGVYQIDITLEDDVLDYQTVDFGQTFKNVKTVEVVIGETYEGAKYEDLCISELKLIN